MIKKVIFLDNVHPCLFFGLEQEGYNCIDLSGQTLVKIKAEMITAFGVILRSRLILDKNLLKDCKNLSFIGRVGSGLENIDIDFCLEKGINLFNSPEGNRTAVAEQALGMILSLFNRFQSTRDQMKKNMWLREENTGTELTGKTIGIIGFGNNGSELVKLLKGFDVKILVYDKYKKLNKSIKYNPVSLSTFFKQCDVVSLHVPLNNETKWMVNNSFLNKFKKPIYLINVSRGKIVKTSDLIKFLKNGRVLGACLDVIDFENNQFNANLKNNKEIQYLLKNENVILTPHTAGLTQESYKKLSEVMLSKIKAHY